MSEINGQVSKSKFTSSSLAHLKAYPIVAETFNFIKGYTLYTFIINYSRQLANVVSPYLTRLPYLTNLLKRVDEFTDNSILTKFDQLFPSITKITYADLKPQAVYQSIKNLITERYNKFTTSLIKRVHSIEDRVRPTLNPVLSPVNNTLELIIKKIFPESPKDVAVDAVESIKSKDELARLHSLTSSVLEKSIPLVSSTRDTVIQLPHEISSHISGVYNEELTSSKNSKEAFVNTSRKLSSEALQSLRPIVNPIFTTVEKDLQDKITAGKNYIDGIVGEVKEGVDNNTYNGSSNTTTTTAAAPVTTPIVTASA